MTAKVSQADADTIKAAVNILRHGGLVAMPTETVYGLAANACNDTAVARIFEAKQRPAFNPLISHVSNRQMAEQLAIFSPLAQQLADRFWPGGLTLVLPKRPDCPVSDLVTAGLDTIAIRMPQHPVAQALIEQFGGPLAAPSANPSERLSPTTAQHVADQLGDKLELILDGGPCRSGIESTVVSLAGDQPALLRPGAIARDIIEAITGPLAKPGKTISSPGMMKRHYAPNARLRINADAPEPGEAWLAFGPTPHEAAANLSPTGDLVEAAANLFHMLRALDAHHSHIAIARIPRHGLGEAINDRLDRASV
ncbi:MAG: threonylcarbamoyl-AMP synthase [Hirschia sp.]|nr:threonylcarbamoyl-AMP synthase [Hirschia sp.]MBF19257.1 threonylcarbamoyl-AMP synthase [Hirschia sp.]